MNTLQTFILLCCIAYACSECYRASNGCRDASTKRRYRIGQKWTPKGSCYSCKCEKAKVTALTCLVAVEKQNATSTLKKSGLISTLVEEGVESNVEFVKILPRQAETVECPPTKVPVFNWVTGQFEGAYSYKTVTYFYFKKESRCCNRFLSYFSVHPSCKVVKVGKCGSKVVQRSNPKRLCEGRMSFVG